MKSIRLAAILALALALRIIWPLADPPVRLTWSNGELTDPPAIVHAARNVVLFGEWERDESKDFAFYPLLNVITAGAFSIFGANRLVIQVLSALFGVGTVAAIAWGLRRSGGLSPFLAAALLAVSFWIVMFSRIPVAENLTVLLLAIAAGFGLGRRKQDFWAAGFFAGVAAFFGKFYALAFLPALAIFVISRQSFSALRPVAGGFGIAMILWIALVFGPRHAAILDQFRRSGELYGSSPILRSPYDLIVAPLRGIRFSWFNLRFSGTALVGAWFVLSTFSSVPTFRRRIANGSALFALWTLFAWIALSVLPYIAPRYFLLAAIPLVVCTAFQIEEWRAGTAPAFMSLRGKWGRLLAYAWIVIVCFSIIDASSHWIAFLNERIYPRSPQASVAFLAATQIWADAVEPFEGSCILAFLFASIAFILWMFFTRRPPREPSRRPGLAALVLVALLGFDLLQYVDWSRSRAYAIEEAKESIDTIIGPDAIVSGTLASAIVLGSRRVAVPLYGDPHLGYLEEMNATHLVLGEPGDVAGLGTSLPEVVDLLVTVRSWPIRARHLRKATLFRIDWPDTSTAAKKYQPTPFEEAVDQIGAEDYAAAFAQLETIRQSGMEISDLYSLQAECRLRMGDDQGARALLEKALQLRPTIPQDLYNLAVLLYRAGERKSAHDLWVKGLRLDPYDIDLAQALHHPVD